MNEDSYTHEHEFPDELISAYLDGELAPAEKRRVEEQLMDSPEHRRLFEELKSLRSSLQALPQETLGDDFAQRVLRRAEQELLTGEAATSEAAPEEPAAKSSTSAAAPRPAAREDHQRGAWRGLIWSAAAMAAAIALIVFSPMFTQQPQRGVALNDADGEHLDRLAENAKATDDRSGDVGPVVGEQKLKGAKQDQIAAPDNQLAQAGGQGFSEARDGTAVSETISESEFKARKQRDASQPPAIHDNLAARRGNQQPAFGGGGSGASVEASGFAPPGANAASRAVAPPSNLAVDQTGGRVASGEKSVPMAAFARGHQNGAVQNSGMLVVSLDVTPDALAGRFMDEMLKKHAIHVEVARAELDRAADIRVADKEGGAARYANSTEQLDAKNELRKKAQEAGGDVELLYVVASADQIDGLLHDLKSQSDEVLALAYDQPLAPQQDENARLEAQSLRQRAFDDVAPASPIRADAAEKAEGDLADAKDKPLASRDAEAVAEASSRPALYGQAIVGQLEGGNEAKADDKYAVDAESYRGIARRLHLPEELEFSDSPLAKWGTSDAEDGQGRESANGNFSPAAVQAGNLGGAASIAAPAADVQDGLLPIANLKDAAKGAGEKQSETEKPNEFPKRALAAEQPPVRVLFVLRAVGRASPLADQVPTDAAAAEENRE